VRIVVIATLIGIVVPSLSVAGVFSTIDTVEETRWKTDDFRTFELTLNVVKALSDSDLSRGEDSPMRRRYLMIDAMGRDGTLKLQTLEHKLNYSAVLIRRGKAYEATQILLPLSREHPKNFLVWSQLGTAKFLSGNPELGADAADCIRMARDLWPTDMEKLDQSEERMLRTSSLGTAIDLVRFAEVEKYLERLIRSRQKAERYAKAKKPLPEGIDPIFIDEESKAETKPPVKFVNENGKFEAGRIVKAEKEKLPDYAIDIVQQLLYWMPHDDRLMWLLGEVYNAKATGLTAESDRNKFLSSSYWVFHKLARFESPPTFAAEMAPRRDALLPYAEKFEKDMRAKREKEAEFQIELPKDPAIDGAGPWPLDWWRTVIVGFITGLAVGMFSIWQLQEIRRRRASR
jgi:hypothetical protein